MGNSLCAGRSSTPLPMMTERGGPSVLLLTHCIVPLSYHCHATVMSLSCYPPTCVSPSDGPCVPIMSYHAVTFQFSQEANACRFSVVATRHQDRPTHTPPCNSGCPLVHRTPVVPGGTGACKARGQLWRRALVWRWGPVIDHITDTGDRWHDTGNSLLHCLVGNSKTTHRWLSNHGDCTCRLPQQQQRALPAVDGDRATSGLMSACPSVMRG